MFGDSVGGQDEVLQQVLQGILLMCPTFRQGLYSEMFNKSGLGLWEKRGYRRSREGPVQNKLNSKRNYPREFFKQLNVIKSCMYNIYR